MADNTDNKYAFNIGNLRKGDILVFNTYHPSHNEKMKSRYIHAALYAGDAFLLESDGFGVARNHIYSYGFKELEDAVVLRVKDISPTQINDVIRIAGTKLGTEYGRNEAYRTQRYKDSSEKEHENKMFCSRLVAKSYACVGIMLVPNPNYCEPKDFIASNKVESVPNILEEADEELRNLIIKKAIERDSGRTVLPLGYLLQNLRALYGEDIQNMDQLNVIASRHPEKDKDCIRLIEDARFFKFKEANLTENPWIESNEKFAQHFNKTDDRLWFIMNQISHIEKTYLPNFRNNEKVCSTLSQCFPNSEYFRYLRDGFDAETKEAEEVLQRMYQLLNYTIDQDREGCGVFFNNL